LRSIDQQAYDLLVEWYDEVYDAVKAASPGTLVFPTLQYERMISPRPLSGNISLTNCL